MRILSFVTLLLCFAGTSFAHDGYAFRDGYYWKDGTAYVKSRVRLWDRHRRQYYYDDLYKLAPQVQVQKQTVHSIRRTDPSWREKLLEIAKEEKDNRAYLEALRLLGTETDSVYPSPSTQHGYDKQQLVEYGATHYGYSFKDVATAYSDIDTMVLYDQSRRLAERSQQLHSQAVAGHQQLVALAGEDAARVAEINAARGLLAEVLRKVRVERTETRIGSEPPPTAANPPADNTTGNEYDGGGSTRDGDASESPGRRGPTGAQLAALHGIVTAKCLSCHNSSEPAAGIDLSQIRQLDPESKRAVMRAITTPNASKRMPKDADPLTVDEIALFFDVLQ